MAVLLNTKVTSIFCSDRPWAASPGLSNTIATTDATNPNGGVHLDFLTNGGKNIAVQPTGVTMAPMDVPVAGISLDGQMYVAISTNFTKGRATERSVLTKFVAPETFQTVRTISELPDGRFIRMSMHAQPGPIAGLPPGGPFILTWGTGRYHESDAYLSIVPAGQFEAGKGIRYFAGLDAVKRSDLERQRIGRNSDCEGRHARGSCPLPGARNSVCG